MFEFIHPTIQSVYLISIPLSFHPWIHQSIHQTATSSISCQYSGWCLWARGRPTRPCTPTSPRLWLRSSSLSSRRAAKPTGKLRKDKAKAERKDKYDGVRKTKLDNLLQHIWLHSSILSSWSVARLTGKQDIQAYSSALDWQRKRPKKKQLIGEKGGKNSNASMLWRLFKVLMSPLLSILPRSWARLTVMFGKRQKNEERLERV